MRRVSEGADAEGREARAPFVRAYDDGDVRWTCTRAAGDGDGDGVREVIELVVRGRGTLAGATRMIEVLDEAIAGAAEDSARLWFDVAQVRGAPLRSQAMFGRWLVRQRHVVHRVVVLGAAPWERRLATFACSVAGFRAFRFFDARDRDEARRWLRA